MKWFRRYREFRAIAKGRAELEIDRNTNWLEREHPHVVLGVLKDRAKRALA